MTAPMDRAALDAAFRAVQAAAWGAVPYGEVAEAMDGEGHRRTEALCPCPQWVLTAAFPYYAGAEPGNLSLYARGMDYHSVVTGRLERVCTQLRAAFPGRTFVPGSDNSPLPERECAWRGGVGLRGLHGLVIVPPYGSYVFLGTILTDHAFALARPKAAEGCGGCGACRRACPGGALRGGAFDRERCLSHLTQKKGELSEGQAALVAGHDLIWGCDACQRVCPYNRLARKTAIAEFSGALVQELDSGELEGLTNRGLRERYPDRAFTWRGSAVLRRNLELQKKKL